MRLECDDTKLQTDGGIESLELMFRVRDPINLIVQSGPVHLRIKPRFMDDLEGTTFAKGRN